MSRVRPLLAMLAVLLLPAFGSAQQQTIVSGIVKSETQSPVRGAFVTVPALNLSAVTNDNGYYRLPVPPGRTGQIQVIISSIGYRTVTRELTLRPGPMELNATMPEQAISLNEVVVTGTAGRQERRAQAAVVSTISAQKVAEVAPVQSVANLLQARTPGVTLRNASGTSGTATTIRIRGQSSINLSNDPLVFIDGIRAQSDNRGLYGVGGQSGSALNDIKIEDIESIEVVKGPAAATLYGSDANAGVINIITKRGRQQSAFTQSITMEYGEADPAFTPPTNYGRCTAAAIASAATPACAGQPVNTILTDNPLVREDAFGPARYRNLAWSLRGGGEKFSTFVSLGADDEDGTLPNNEYGHVSGRANFDFFASEKVRMEFGFAMVRTTTQLPRNDNDIYGYLGGGLLGDPRTRGATKDGWYAPNRQVLAISAYENKDKTLRIQPRTSVTYSPYQWFTNRLTFGADLTRTRAFSFWAKNDVGWWDAAPLNTGQIGEARRAIDRLTLDYLGNITRNINTDLRADVSFGTQLLTRKQDTVDATGQGLVSNTVRTVSSAATLSGGGQNSSEDRTIGFFSQVQLTFRDKLYLQVGGRVDQASAFGIDSKPFYSPKVGVSYVISDEAYFRNLIPENIVNQLRLRTAYGVTGRAPTSGARSTYSPTTNQITATTAGVGVTPGATGNPDLRAEKGQELELGFDAGFLNDKLGVELTYFHKKGIDQILSQPLPGSQGASSPDVNVGAILNKGFEVAATARPLTRENVSFEIRGAVNTLHNEVLDLGGTPPTTTRKIGFPLGGVWDYRIRRVDVANNITIVSDTLEFIGNNSNLPGYEGTLSGTLTLFRNLSFYAQADGRGERVVYNNTDQFRDRQNGGIGGALGVIGCKAFMPDISMDCDDAAKEKYMRKFGCVDPCKTLNGAVLYWQTENGRRLALTDVRGDYNEDGGFIRLREASVSYRLPRELIARYMRAQTASVTVSMRNLHTWTDFTGLDPETDQFLTAPQDRRWTARFNFTF